jgi:hypothetical protein
MRRLRQIDDETAEHARQLADARAELRQRAADPAEFERLWEELAHRWRFDAVNELIDRHNRYFPAEARLPMDPVTRDYALVNGKPYRLDPLDADWILARFPAALDRAA